MEVIMMNNRYVERLLRGKADKLPKGDFPLKIYPTNFLEREVATKVKKPIKTIFRIALFTASLVVLAFSVSLVVNAEFRNAVMSFFRASSPEVIQGTPSTISSADKNHIKLIGKQRIENIADVFYFSFGGNSVSNDISAVNQPDGTVKYYKIENDVTKEITPTATQVSDVITFKGRKIPLHFEYGTLDGKPYLRNLPGTLSGMADSNNTAYAFYQSNVIWVDVSSGNQVSYNAYYILYNLETRDVIDIMKGIVSDNKSIDTIQFSPDKTKLLLQEFSGGYPGNYIYFDTSTKTAVSLKTLTGLDKVYTCSFIDDDLLYNQQYQNALHPNMLESEYVLNGYCYRISNKNTTTIFENLSNSSNGIGDNGLIYSFGGVCIFKSIGEIKITTSSGESYTVEGIDLSQGYYFLMNPNHTKIAILNLSGSRSNSLGISEIGIIDLPKNEIKIFERKGFEKNDEVNISWNDSSSLVVTTSDNAFYLYRFF
jgi:hypothetical protein